MQSSKLKSPYLQKTLCYSSVFFLNNEENNARKEKRETSHPIAEMLSVKGNFLGHTRTHYEPAHIPLFLGYPSMLVTDSLDVSLQDKR